MRQRRPTTPGEILTKEFLRPLRLAQTDLARHLGCDVKVVNRIVNGRSAVTVEMAIRLGAALRTGPELWLNAQQAIDIYRATKKARKLPARLTTLRVLPGGSR
jgi:addiction module HigA family antidote